MSDYNYTEDKKIYRENHTKILNFTRALLTIWFIIQFVCGEKPYETLIIIYASYWFQSILNYRKVKYKENFWTIIFYTILMIGLVILAIGKYV